MSENRKDDPVKLASERVKPSIHELEKILEGEAPAIEIMPDGQIRAIGDENWVQANPKPITFQQALSSSY